MNERWLPLLRCPCDASPLELDPVRRAGPELVEGFLVSEKGRRTYPLVAGIAVLLPDLTQALRRQGSVFWRTPLADPRVARFVLGRAGRGVDVVPFEEVVARYGDLRHPPGERSMAEEDQALADVLSRLGPPPGRALDIGCGVGRSTFTLAGVVGTALGVDRSSARVRRARNVAVTCEDFFLPPDPQEEGGQRPIDVDRLPREGADFAVASGESLPFAAASFDVVCLREGDASAAWAEPARARAEAERVLAPGGLLLLGSGGEAPAWAPAA